MLVKIICGSYGHRPNANEPRVIRKDSDSPAFELNDEEAKRIIDLGIAEACSFGGVQESDGIELPQMTEEELMSLDFNEMRKLAREYGLDSKGTKDQLLARLKEAFLKEDASNEDDGDVFVDEEDAPPQLEAREPV